MNKKNWYDVSTDFFGGIILGIVGFVCYFFVLNVAYAFPSYITSIVSIYLKGAIMGLWLGAITLIENNGVIAGMSISIFFLTPAYNYVVTKFLPFLFGPFDTITFINSFVLGVIIINIIWLIIRKKTEAKDNASQTTNPEDL